MDDTGHVEEETEDDVDKQGPADAAAEENPDRRQKDGEENENESAHGKSLRGVAGISITNNRG
jgi:hypothetical protein